MGWAKDVKDAQQEVNRARRGDGCGDLSRDAAVRIAKDRRNATLAGHGRQPSNSDKRRGR